MKNFKEVFDFGNQTIESMFKTKNPEDNLAENLKPYLTELDQLNAIEFELALVSFWENLQNNFLTIPRLHHQIEPTSLEYSLNYNLYREVASIINDEVSHSPGRRKTVIGVISGFDQRLKEEKIKKALALSKELDSALDNKEEKVKKKKI